MSTTFRPRHIFLARPSFALAFACLAGPPARASTTFSAGQIAFGEFITMQSSGSSFDGWVLDHGFNRLASGESYRFTVYEDSLPGIPIFDRTIHGSGDTGLSGFIFFGQADLGHFSDLQGTFSIEMLSGSLDVDAVRFFTRVDGSVYFANVSQFAVVPEPASAGFWCATALLARRVRRR